jgi:hypothetical protein
MRFHVNNCSDSIGRDAVLVIRSRFRCADDEPLIESIDILVAREQMVGAHDGFWQAWHGRFDS